MARAFDLDSEGRSQPLFEQSVIQQELVGQSFFAQAFVVDRVAQGGVSFTPAVALQVGARPAGDPLPRTLSFGIPNLSYALLTAQLDGEGPEDIVVPAMSTSDYWVVLPRANGTFIRRRVNAGGQPWQARIVDVDGDGHLDLVCRSFSMISVVRGRGDGTFEQPVRSRIQWSGGGFRYCIGDMDGDGMPDAVVSWPSEGRIAWMRGQGDGSFAWVESIDLPRRPWDLYLEDLDLDGNQDLVVLECNDASVGLYWGDGAGGFVEGQRMLVDEPRDLVITDWDLDGFEDLVVGQSPGLTLFRSVPDPPSFRRKFQRRETGFADTCISLRQGDLNGDGRDDVLVERFGGVTVLVAQADGFAVQGSFLTDLIIGLGECTGDDRLDLLTSRGSSSPLVEVSGPVRIHSGLGNGRFDGFSSYLSSVGSGNLGIGDLDLDGRPDAVVVHREAATFLLAGGPAEKYETAAPIPLPVRSAVFQSLAMGDVDGDGVDDAVVAGSSPVRSEISVLLGDGAGGLSDPVTVSTEAAGDLVLGDFDRDDALDLAITGSRLRVLRGDGRGRFSAPSIVDDVFHHDLAVADADGDGWLDLFAIGPTSVVLYRGAGLATFAPAQVIASTGSFREIAVEDLDRDGHPDVALLAEDGTVRVLGGGVDGDGFAVRQELHAARSGRSLLVGDYNRDGLPDLLFSNWADGEVILLPALDGGEYGILEPFELGRFVPTVSWDMDGDLIPDLVGSEGLGLVVAPNQILRNPRTQPVPMRGPDAARDVQSFRRAR